MNAKWDEHERLNRRDDVAFWREVEWQSRQLDWTPPPLADGWGPVEISARTFDQDRIVFVHGLCQRADGATIQCGVASRFGVALFEYRPEGRETNPLYLVLTLWDAVNEVHCGIAESKARFAP